LLNIKFAEKNTSMMLKALKELNLEIVSVDDLVTTSKEAKRTAEKLVKEDVDLLVMFLSTFTEDPIIANNKCVALCWDFSSPCYKTALVES